MIPAAQHQAITKLAQKTNHIERFNNALRQRASRLGRDRHACAKKRANHIGASRYCICDYNLTRAAVNHVDADERQAIRQMWPFFHRCTDKAYGRNACTTCIVAWGLAAGGGAFGLASFLNPSSVADAGFRAAVPLYDFLNNLTGPGKLWNWDVTATYIGSYWVIACGLIALAAMMTIIEMKLAIATSAVLVPWAVLT